MEKHGINSITVRKSEPGFIWCDLSIDMQDIVCTLSARLPKENYPLDRLQNVALESLARRIRELLSLPPQAE